MQTLCSCGSGKPGQYEEDVDKIVYAFVCPDCREQRLAKYAANQRLRNISQTPKWWRDPALLHRFSRLLSRAGYRTGGVVAAGCV